MHTYSPHMTYSPYTERVQGQDWIHEHVVKAHALTRVLLKLHDLRRMSTSTLHDYLWVVDEHVSEAFSQCTVIQLLKEIGRTPDKTNAQDETYKRLARAEVIITRLLSSPNLKYESDIKLLEQVRLLDQHLNAALRYADFTLNGVLAHERKPSN